MTVVAELRKEYRSRRLEREDLAADPMLQFQRWLADALAADVPEPNAMTLATATADGFPNARIVLLKGVDSRGFSFFTNYQSPKGTELSANPRAALVFLWHELERQVRIRGPIERVSREESEQYFHSRPFASQLGAWASAQSEVLCSREELETRLQQLQEQYAEPPVGMRSTVPCPDYWGGFRVVPVELEFWQGRPSRLHDRFRYRRQGLPGSESVTAASAAANWIIERLAP